MKGLKALLAHKETNIEDEVVEAIHLRREEEERRALANEFIRMLNSERGLVFFAILTAG